MPKRRAIVAPAVSCAQGHAKSQRVIEQPDGSRVQRCERCSAILAVVSPPFKRWTDAELAEEADRRAQRQAAGLPLTDGSDDPVRAELRRIEQAEAAARLARFRARQAQREREFAEREAERTAAVGLPEQAPLSPSPMEHDR